LPSAVTHAVVGAAAAVAFAPQGAEHIWPYAVASSTILDLDVISFFVPARYHHFFGHRGFFHSLFFCLFLAVSMTAIFLWYGGPVSGGWYTYLTFFFLLSANHGFLDMLTKANTGVAVFSPFKTTRYLFPWRPIPPSPFDISAFVGTRGLNLLRIELLGIWVPSLAVVAASELLRHLT
jgi:inner membrane protein